MEQLEREFASVYFPQASKTNSDSDTKKAVGRRKVLLLAEPYARAQPLKLQKTRTELGRWVLITLGEESRTRSSYRHTTVENIATPDGVVKNAGYLQKEGLVLDYELMVMTGKTNREEKHTYRILVEKVFQN